VRVLFVLSDVVLEPLLFDKEEHALADELLADRVENLQKNKKKNLRSACVVRVV